MPTEPESASIAEELDATHRRAMEHFRNKNVSAYMRLFASDLRYRQINGVEIGKEQLTRDVEAQLSHMASFDSSYKRESLSIEGDRAIEHLVQTASATLRVFRFFRRTWRIHRSGRYTWAKTPDG